MITSAYNASAQRVDINRAVSGQNYTRPDHPGCVLRPVHSTKRQSHFRHKGQVPDCPERTNESIEHAKIKEVWINLLNQQLSGCFVCVCFPDHVLDRDPHPCPVLINGDGKSEPWFKTILWLCGECLKPHVYDFLELNDSVRSEAWVLGRSCRPDITIFDSDGNPKSIIEFRKTSSGKSREVADSQGISWFEIDVFRGHEFAAELINDTRRFWDDFIDVDQRMKDIARSLDSAIPGSTEYMPAFGDDGQLLDTFFAHKPDEKDEGMTEFLPQPHIGHFLFANRSNLGCKSQHSPRPIS